MKVLIIGAGGREHALAYKMAQSTEVDAVFVAPGNAGTALESKVSNVDINPFDFMALARFAKNERISLTVVGPETPLADGLVDFFVSQDLPCFGPCKAAAQLEASKVFSKEFMTRCNIPTAKYQNFKEIQAAKAYVREQGTPIVIKASGLAGGKGVVVAQTEEEAFTTIENFLNHATLGLAGSEIVIEEFLEGEEASFIVMSDGQHVVPLASSQDHKARDDGDRGPNTGGMGAYSPAPVVTPTLHDEIMKRVIQPVIDEMRNMGHPYIGFLYAGIMITNDQKINVLEFNCRLGDPEAQPLLMRLKSDLYVHCKAALAGNLDTQTFIWDPRPALGVVMAMEEYPAHSKTEELITLPQSISEDCKIFHAGTVQTDQGIITHGGRILCVTALGNDIKDAQQRVYAVVKQVHWDHCHYRTDIGYRAIM